MIVILQDANDYDVSLSILGRLQTLITQYRSCVCFQLSKFWKTIAVKTDFH